MKRNLQESRKVEKTQVIYEGNGFAKVMKGGKLVERIQLENGDNLLESLKALTEGREVRKASTLDSQYDSEVIQDLGGGRSLEVTSEGGGRYIPEYLNILIMSYKSPEEGISVPVTEQTYYKLSNKIIDDLYEVKSMDINLDDIEKVVKKYTNDYFIVK